MEPLNKVRGSFFLLGVLRNQQNDPCCSRCSAFANTLQKVREDLAVFETAQEEALREVSPEFRQLLAEARSGFPGLQPPSEPSGQKKAGKCKLPQGSCFIKSSLSLFQNI